MSVVRVSNALKMLIGFVKALKIRVLDTIGLNMYFKSWREHREVFVSLGDQINVSRLGKLSPVPRLPYVNIMQVH